MTTSRLRAVLAVLLLAAAASAAASDMRADMAVMDSLRQVPPRLRSQWLRERGMDTPFLQPSKSDSAGIRAVGRWSFGPAYDVDGRITPSETLIALARGSGVSLVAFSRSGPERLRLLSDVNAEHLVEQVRLRDGILFVGTPVGLETYDIANGSSPLRLSWIQTSLNGFDIRDTLAYIISDDSFSVYSIANLSDPYRISAVADSGSSVTVAGSTAFLADRWGLYALDISNPAAPHRVGIWGSAIVSAEARGNICCVTQQSPDKFTVLDVSNPSAITVLDALDGVGGYDIHLDGPLAFLSGFSIVSLADTTDVQLIGNLGISGYKFGVWGESGFDVAAVANNDKGLVLVSLDSMSGPAFDTALLGAGSAVDVDICGGRAHVADGGGGLKTIDVTDPERPSMLGELDTLDPSEGCYAVAANDSQAFIGWFNTPFFRTVDVSDPTRPAVIGSCSVFEYAQDIVLRDSLVYCAENYRFQIVNVARPRAPQVVGTCNLGNLTYGMRMRDSLAYVCSYPLAIINTANPADPVQVGSIPHGAWNVFPKDSLAYVAAVGLVVWNVSDPTGPFAVDSLQFGRMVYDVLIRDTVAYLACSDGLRTASIADVHNMRVTGYAPLPYIGWRLADDSAHIYVAVEEAGVCIFDTVAVGIAEERPAGGRPTVVGMRGSVVRDELVIELAAAVGSEVMLSAYDMSGRCVEARVLRGHGQEVRYSFARLPAGVYVLRVRFSGQTQSFKVVKL